MMKNMKPYLWFALLFALVANCALADGVKYTGTFSSIAYNDESGDLSGVELRIIVTKKGYVGTLQICEGGAGNLIVVHPTIEKGSIRFAIADTLYGGSFAGSIQEDGIHGKFTFSGNVGAMEFFPRKKSYWD